MINQSNIALVKAAIEAGSVTGDWRPSVYVIEPTNRCNVNCIMCPNSKFTESELGDISLPAAKIIFDKIAPYAELTMLYFLGESTIHPNFIEILSTARETLRGKIVVSTNALYLPDALCRSLVESCDIIITCIDRWQARAYEAIRRGSNFTQVVQSIERLLAARRDGTQPTVIVKGLDITLSREDASGRLEEAAAFKKYWEDRGAVPLSGWLNTWAGQMSKLERLASEPTPYTSSERSACADLWFKMVVNWRGEVVLCCHDWRSTHTFGNITVDDLDRIWHGAGIAALRVAHVAKDFGVTSMCAGCKEWGAVDELQSYIDLLPADLYRVF